MTRTITIAHSPDADDAFMFYALTVGKVGHPGFRYEHTLQDIQTLNEWAREGRFDVTALSVHAYAYLADRYAVLRSGASMGESDYGPMVVAREPLTRAQLQATTIAVPGKMTTAYLLLQLALGGETPLECVVMPFDAILPAVREGRVAAGLLIHEGQLTYHAEGLVSVLDLFRWWHDAYQLPVPLGFNGIRRDLDPAVATQVASDIRASIAYAIDHRDEAVAYAQRYGRGLSADILTRFVGMYVNQRTLRMGDDEEQAIRTLYAEAQRRHLISQIPSLDWVGQ